MEAATDLYRALFGAYAANPVRWNYGAAPGATLALTYNFSTDLGTATERTPIAFSDTQKAVIRDALDYVSTVINVTFTEIVSDARDAGDFTFYGTDGSGGSASGPELESNVIDGAMPPRCGRVHLGLGDNSWANVDPTGDSTYAGFRETVLHEVGHGLGLMHPRVYTPITSAPYWSGDSTGYAVALTDAEDTKKNTIMSYLSGGYTGDQFDVSYRVWDLQALQQLYGANTATSAGDDRYALAPDDTLGRTLWDGGGTDTLDASALVAPARIDLREGAFSSAGGKTVNGVYYPAADNLSIAVGTVIENAIGGAGSDTLVGNAAANALAGGDGADGVDGGAGDDTLLGGAGSDTLLGGLGRDVLAGGGGADLFLIGGADGSVDRILDFETGDRIRFAGLALDGTVAASGAPAPGRLVAETQGDDTLLRVADAAAPGGETRVAVAGLLDVARLRVDGGDLVLGAETPPSGGSTPVVTPPDSSGGADPTPVTPPAQMLFGRWIDGVYANVPATAYVGPVDHLNWQFLGDDRGEVVGGSDADDFLNLLGGNDAANGGAGADVLDGGAGSNWLVGGAGNDTFFVDGRGGTITWSTVTDLEKGEWATIWGFRNGVSTLSWKEMDGADGYRGATIHCDLDGNGVIDSSMTFAGAAVASLTLTKGVMGDTPYIALIQL